MSEPATEATGFTLHHIGLVVPDLETAAEWYCRAFGLVVAWREPWTEPDSQAIGLPGRPVSLCGAGLRFADSPGTIELHQFRSPNSAATERRTSDLGFGHLAFHVADLPGQVARLRDMGMSFLSDVSVIESAPLAGARWVYGTDPWGNVLELLNWAAVCDGIG